MKTSKRREHWKEMTRETLDIKRKTLGKEKYGAKGSYVSYRLHFCSKKQVTNNNSRPYTQSQLL